MDLFQTIGKILNIKSQLRSDQDCDKKHFLVMISTSAWQYHYFAFWEALFYRKEPFN